MNSELIPAKEEKRENNTDTPLVRYRVAQKHKYGKIFYILSQSFSIPKIMCVESEERFDCEVRDRVCGVRQKR